MSRGIVTGFEDGTFRPLAAVTRQQFAKMIVKTLGYPVTGSESSPFGDVATQVGTDPFYLPATFAAPFAGARFTLQEHFQNAREAAYAGLLNGLQGVGPSYDFGATASRGECAQLLYNLSTHQD